MWQNNRCFVHDTEYNTKFNKKDLYIVFHKIGQQTDDDNEMTWPYEYFDTKMMII